MKISKIGITRTVFIFNSFVIKIPNHRYSHQHFLQGCSSNWIERLSTKQWKYCHDWGSGSNLYELIAPTYFCSWFGLFQVQAKCIPFSGDLTSDIRKKMRPVCRDMKNDNLGWFKGNLVCFDYN